MAITRIPRIREFPSDGRFWRIDWFGGVERNPYVPSEPAIQVLLSPLRTPSSLSDTDPASVRAINAQEQTTVLVGTGPAAAAVHRLTLEGRHLPISLRRPGGDVQGSAYQSRHDPGRHRQPPGRRRLAHQPQVLPVWRRQRQIQADGRHLGRRSPGAAAPHDRTA